MDSSRGTILVVFAHPYPRASRACAATLAALHDIPDTVVHSLYDRYPDFDIDVAAEQAAAARADLLVWLHPLYWYGPPALLKHWFDTVLVRGWAYGDAQAGALAGKACLWAVTTGGDEEAFSPPGRHGRAFADFVAPVEQIARYCGMTWMPPHVVHGAHDISAAALAQSARALRDRLAAWQASRPQAPR